MSKKILISGGVVLVALVVAVASMLLFAKLQPTEAEVRAAVEMALPDGAVVDQMTFAVFSDDRSKGRVSVKGTYSFPDDIFSLPTPPLKLMQALAPSQIFDREVATWWAENSSFYPQFNGKLGEFRKIYSDGQSIDFSGELPYLAIVDGTKIDNSGLEFKTFEGTVKPAFGYPDDALQVIELRKAIVEWRDRRLAEAAAAEAVRAAEAEVAAQSAAKAAEAEAVVAAKAEEARLVAEAVAAAAAKAAYEAEAARNRPLTPAAFTTKTIGTFVPLQIKSGERIGPINLYEGTCLSWSKSGFGMFWVYSRPDFTSDPVRANFTDQGYGIKSWGHEGVAFQVFLEAERGDIQIELERREPGNACQ